MAYRYEIPEAVLRELLNIEKMTQIEVAEQIERALEIWVDYARDYANECALEGEIQHAMQM